MNRGMTDPDAARRFLTPDFGHLHDPLLLTGMREAVARIRSAIQAKEKILIYGDYDVDGTVSVVILKKAIEMAGGEASFHVPHRLKDGYGMRSDVIERAAAMGIALIVSVDTGIRASEVVREAHERGIDVIVTDHHLPDAELPPALAVLNPNRRDCQYPDKNLCGAGVAFKLVHALLGTLGWPAEKLARVMKSFLKLVAIATVADVVPLVGENRVIVKHGLDGLHHSKNPGLRAILELSGLMNGRSPSARQVAFQIAPRINAAGRMDDAQNVIRMFLTDDPEHAHRLASELHSLNQVRRDTEAEIVRLVLEECAGVPVTDDQTVLVFSGLNWHRGVVGIVASRIVEKFHRPAFVLGVENGVVQGSGRSIAAFHLLEALESMPELFQKFGGHRQAAGVTFAEKHLGQFRERLRAYAADRLTPTDFERELAIDSAIALEEIDSECAAAVLNLAPFGYGNPLPLFAALSIELDAPPDIREKIVLLRLKTGGRPLRAKAWDVNTWTAAAFAPGTPLDVVFQIEEDSYSAARGYEPWQIVIRDVRASAAAQS
jgi:single-stranded-DNA-specific exonuclease